ncbi:MAG: hypothetical protein LBN05_00305 [Oscillospiraceae bacterium]|jgi:hypothetical protein|nr:hypothetical protein [Oscillospiraceae bacterium]
MNNCLSGRLVAAPTAVFVRMNDRKIDLNLDLEFNLKFDIEFNLEVKLKVDAIGHIVCSNG